MSPKRKNPKLPCRVTQKHGAYYYLRPIIKNGKNTTQWIRLGKTEREMHQRLAELKSDGAGLMSAIIQRYREDVMTKKAKSTQAAQGAQLNRLSKAFGHMRPSDLRPSHIASYHDLVGKSAPYQANRELALITHVLKYAVRWGYIDKNPSREIQRHPEAARERYITHEEYVTVRDAAPEWIGILMDLAYVTGQRRVDLLSLKRNQITDDGLAILQSKTKTRLLLSWTPDLQRVISRALESQTVQSVYVICDAKGQKRKDSAFTTAWTRLMDRLIADPDCPLTERFQFRDIRGKAGSDSSGEHLGHRSQSTLMRHYKRLPKQVKPTQ